MAIEIGSLVVRGTFGQQQREDMPTNDELRNEMKRLRRDMLREMKDMVEQANRRTMER